MSNQMTRCRACVGKRAATIRFLFCHLMVYVALLLAVLVWGEQPSAQAAGTDSHLPGIPCGRGEQFPDWGVCLHGTVYDAGGTPLAGAEITVELDGNVVSGTTSIHPSETEPSYGIDISPLEPEYLQTISLQVTANGSTTEREIIVLPDYRTQNQQFDVRLGNDGPLADGVFWGYVMDFGTGQPVVGATVTAEYNGTSVAVNTVDLPPDPEPRYVLGSGEMGQIGATAGATVTLTAEFDGLRASGIVTVPDPAGPDAPRQQNFLIGWRCDTTGILPRGGGSFGVPRGGGSFGVPNEGCIWGYGIVDGSPEADMAVLLEVDGQIIGQGITRFFADEQQPRYAILVPDADGLQDALLTVSGVYNGAVTRGTTTINWDGAGSQRVDLELEGTGALASFVNSDDVRGLALQGDILWVAAADGGLARHDLNTGAYRQFTTLDGLAGNQAQTVVVDPQGGIWVGTFTNGISRYDPVTDTWQTFNHLNSDLQLVTIRTSVMDGDTIWFGGGASSFNAAIERYTPATDTWERFTNQSTNSGLVEGSVRRLTLGGDGSLWVGTATGVSHYTPGVQPAEWMTYTTESTGGGLMAGTVQAITLDNDGNVWIGTNSGLSRFTPGAQASAWMTYTRESTNNGLAWNSVRDIVLTPDGPLWFTTLVGMSRYDPATGQWDTPYTTANTNGLPSSNGTDIEPGANGSLWFGTDSGITHYLPGTGEWVPLTTGSTIPTNVVHAIGEGTDGDLWFGTNGFGAMRYSPTNGTWQTYINGSQPQPTSITAIIDTAGGLVDDHVNAILGLGDGTLWFGTAAGVSRYTVATDNWQAFTSVSTGGGLPASPVRAIALGADGALWFATDAGASRHVPGTNDWQAYTMASTAGDAGGGLPSDALAGVAVDSGGLVWFATDNGVSRYQITPLLWTNFTTATTGGGLPSNTVMAVAAAADGIVWFGTDAGTSRYEPGGTPAEWTSFTTASTAGDSGGGLQDDHVGTVVIAPDDSIWFGVLDGVSRYTPNGNPEWEAFVPGIMPPNSGILGHIDPPEIFFTSTGDLWYGSTRGLSQETVESQHSDLVVGFAGENPTTAVPGEEIRYNLAISNQGERAAATMLTLTLPVGATYLGATLPESGTSPLTWELAAVQPDIAPISITIDVQLDPAALPGASVESVAMVAPSLGEDFLDNNTARFSTLLRDPDRADLRATLIGPALLEAGGNENYTIYVDNVGGAVAENSSLVVTLPQGLSTANPLSYDLGSIAFGRAPQRIDLPVSVGGGVLDASRLTVAVNATTSTKDADPVNNQAVATVPTAATDVETLILVAGEQMAQASGYGAAPLLPKLYELADHPRVTGLVVDVQQNSPVVAAAYAAWNAAPNEQTLANGIAESIKTLINEYMTNFPTLRYVVFVGGDNIIPYYRVEDRSDTFWSERRYATYALPPGSVHGALLQDSLLTDDFYADQQPIFPISERWEDGARPLYLPDFASGRLVETPGEITAAIDAFLANDGVIGLGPNILGGDLELTWDTTDQQCELLRDDGLPAAVCSAELDSFRSAVLNHTGGTIWSSQHSNHYSMGDVQAVDFSGLPLQSYAQSLLVTIGCHATLNVPLSPGSLPDFDLVQAFAGQGGTVIGTSAYAYASRLKPSYSEDLLLALTRELLAGGTQTVGSALVAAKHRYYAEHAGWVDYLDEKVLIPVTLYGLPMLQITTPGNALHGAALQAPRSIVDEGRYMVASYTDLVDPMRFERNSVGEGSYDDYAGQVLAQEGLPVQPAHEVPIEPLAENGNGTQTARGILLRSAKYVDETGFTPVIGESWVVGMPEATRPAAVMQAVSGWDRPLPFGFGATEGFTGASDREDVASINLILGAYHADDGQRYRRFNDMRVDVLFSDHADTTAPTIDMANGYRVDSGVLLLVEAQDPAGIADVMAICDDGAGSYSDAALNETGLGDWEGLCPVGTVRFFVQVVDGAGNIAAGGWQTPSSDEPPDRTQTTYLPTIRR